MPEPLPAASRPVPSRIGLLALAFLIAALVGCLQFAAGSRRSELGSHPDEAAHFVTGLMVHDYLISGFHEPPLRYADEYYRHYPKIGLGVWPPFFYLVQAAWTLLLPVGIGSILTLMAVLGCLVAFITGWRLWREFGWAPGVTGAILIAALPLVQQYTSMVMAEILSALLMLCATLCFASFLDSGASRAAAGFGIFAGLAIMTKGTGLALVFVPPLAIVFTRRLGLLKNPRLWLAALIVLVIAGPWTWHFRNQGRGGWEEPSPSVRFTLAAMAFYGRQLLVASGWLVALPAAAGVLAFFAQKTAPTLPASALALILGVWLFQCLTPVGLEARHLTPALPAMVILAMTGLHWLTRDRPMAVPVACAALLLLFFALPFVVPPISHPVGYGSLGNQIGISPFRIARKEWQGFKPVADACLAGDRRHFLVSSDARGEGMFIAQIALRDPHRPTFTVDRASKLLASSTWSGGGYQSFYNTPSEMLSALGRTGIEAIVVDLSPATLPAHEKLLLDALHTTHYQPLGAWDALRDGALHKDALQVFRPLPPPKLNPVYNPASPPDSSGTPSK